MKHVVTWHTPSPLWTLSLEDSGTAPARFEEPALLSFAGDKFIDEIQSVLATDPARLAEFVARPETYRTGKFQRAGWLLQGPLASEPPLKLYQPAHNRFYLIAANLVCREKGLPERAVNTAAGERVAFLMRRLVPTSASFDPEQESTFDEYAWIGDRQQGSWLRQPVRDVLAPGEERLPTFPLTFQQNGQSRRLLAGLPPVGSREMYEAGAPPLPSSELAADSLADERLVSFRESVIGGFEQLRDMPSNAGDTAAEITDARLTLAFVLLDFADFLNTELNALWQAVDARSSTGLSGATLDVYTFLASFHPVTTSTWVDLLDDVAANRSQILLGNLPAALLINHSSFNRAAIKAAAAQILQAGANDYRLFELMQNALGDPRKAEWRDRVAENIAPLEQLPASFANTAGQALLEAVLPIDAWLSVELPTLWAAIAAADPAGLSATARAVYNLLESQSVRGLTWRAILADAEANRASILAGKVTKASKVIRNAYTLSDVTSFAGAFRTSALTDRIDDVLDATPVSTPVPPVQPSPGTFYRIRLVYERPQCPGDPPVVSKPSRPFQLASFFDSEAPVRQLRVQMPLDTSIAGLRGAPKNFAVVLSDELRRQMGRVQAAGMQGLLDGDIPDAALPPLGMICSFSIPIVTICGLLVLMIMVQLLNIVFWWLPLFRICFPLPVKAK